MVSFCNAAILAAMGLALSSCGDAGASDETSALATASPTNDTALQNADLGPFSYQFDPNALTAVDVDIDIPPEYDTAQPATKLIPESRARLLGQDSCVYGQSGKTSKCNAQQEVGLTLALLARPVAEYRRAFDDADLRYEAPSGANAFSFTAQAEGAGTRYSFFGLQDRTILLARHFDDESDAAADAAIDDVIRSLSESIEDRAAETD